MYLFTCVNVKIPDVLKFIKLLWYMISLTLITNGFSNLPTGSIQMDIVINKFKKLIKH